jgi:hypothetical protein
MDSDDSHHRFHELAERPVCSGCCRSPAPVELTLTANKRPSPLLSLADPSDGSGMHSGLWNNERERAARVTS